MSAGHFALITVGNGQLCNGFETTGILVQSFIDMKVEVQIVRKG